MDQTPSTRIPVNIEDEMKRSYMDYAMSVIIGRALPDVRDGLKPANRRVLFAMRQMGLASNRPYRKCAKIVGEVIGNYHPHGDAPAYDTLVRLAQDFNMRYILVDGQGNFGSIDGDPPAAYRYTEARLEALAEAMMADLDKDTVDFRPNFDETTEEPDRAADAVPEPARQRIDGHRRRHGDEHSAAQHARGHRRRHSSDRAPHGAEGRTLPRAARRRFPGRTFRPAARSSAAKASSRPTRKAAAASSCAARRRSRSTRRGDRVSIVDHRDPVSGQQEEPDRGDRRARPRQEDRGHLRHPRRVEPRGHADRHRAQARRAAGRRAEQPLQAHEAADGLRHHAAGDRRAAGRAC